MSGRIIFPPKNTSETIPVVFDFISAMLIGDTINTKSVAASVYTGVDANPSAIVSGSATHSGTRVTQKIAAGVLGVIYELVCTVVTTSGYTLKLSGYLAVEPNLP